MRYRKYTKNSPKVSEIGYGSWQLGNPTSWSPMSDAEAMALIREAIDRGINFFDTAPNYGNGMSEILLGKTLKHVDRSKLVINTKFGHNEKGETDFRPEAIRRSIEGSLSRLKTDYLDSILLHNPSRKLMDPEQVPHYDILETLKAEGKIRAYGASVDTAADMEYFMEKTNGEVMEVFFNMIHQDTRHAFAQAKARDIALIAKIPLDSGWLTGKYNQESTFSGIRSRWSVEDIIKRADAIDLMRDLPAPQQSLAQLALSYCLAYEAVSTVIPGCVSKDQLIDNVHALNTPMASEMVQYLEKLYREHLEPMQLPW